MKVLGAAEVGELLDYGSLINVIDDAFADGVEMPTRHHHTIPATGGRDATLLVMPAWDRDKYIGVKTVCVMPDNANQGMAAVQATYQLFDRRTGQPLALLDGPELTARRTASASALAARYLAREESSRLLMIGTGVLASHLIRAHAAARPLEHVFIWGRNPDKAKKIAALFTDDGFTVEAVSDLDTAVASVDIISCATLALDPLIRGNLLIEGQHVDLVGGFTPLMREADDDAIRKARVYVDTPGACEEAGDISQPLTTGVLTLADIQGDLFSLSQGRVPGRQSAAEITLFKSAGCALEDLAAARLAYHRSGKSE